MIVTETRLAGAFVLEIEKLEDERGWFGRAFCARELEAHGINTRIAQVNISANRRRGTIRGLHYQASPHGETKVVRVVRGAIYDVIVDLRPDSPTYCGWFGVELDDVSCKSLYVPLGFAHGFQTLTDDVEILYLMGDFYAPGSARGIRYDDPAVGIAWPEPATTISEGDLAFAPFVR